MLDESIYMAVGMLALCRHVNVTNKCLKEGQALQCRGISQFLRCLHPVSEGTAHSSIEVSWEAAEVGSHTWPLGTHMGNLDGVSGPDILDSAWLFQAFRK